MSREEMAWNDAYRDLLQQLDLERMVNQRVRAPRPAPVKQPPKQNKVPRIGCMAVAVGALCTMAALASIGLIDTAVMEASAPGLLVLIGWLGGRACEN